MNSQGTFMKLVTGIGMTFVVGFSAPPVQAAGLQKLPDLAQQAQHISSFGEPAQYRIFERSQNRLRLEDEAGKRKHTSLPKKHVDYCIRLNSDYRQWNNTIASSRYSREQCFSRYYRAY